MLSVFGSVDHKLLALCFHAARYLVGWAFTTLQLVTSLASKEASSFFICKAKWRNKTNLSVPFNFKMIWEI